jgi:predicted DNA-binding transcriptional regulator YafY
MDILRHVPEVEVLEPLELRENVIEKLRAGLAAMSVSVEHVARK